MFRLLKRIAAAALVLTLLLAPAAQAITPDQLKELLQEYYLNDIPQAALEAETVEDIIDALGEHVFKSFVSGKRAEWDEYRTRVTDWETQRYMIVY